MVPHLDCPAPRKHRPPVQNPRPLDKRTARGSYTSITVLRAVSLRAERQVVSPDARRRGLSVVRLRSVLGCHLKREGKSVGSTQHTFQEWIERHEAHRSTRAGVLLIPSAGQCLRYYRFLHRILSRYVPAADASVEIGRQVQQSLQGVSGELSVEQLDLLEVWREREQSVSLDIETFYLFANILLGRIAQFIECCFGTGQKCSLNSHRKLVKNLAKFAEQKSLALSSETLEAARELETTISETRDHQFTHENCPRTVRGVTYGNIDPSDFRMVFIRTFPKKEGDEQVETIELRRLMSLLDKYVSSVLRLVDSHVEQWLR